MMVDYRCPRCNWPMKGKHEMVELKNKPPKTITCQKCNKPAKLNPTPCELGGLYYNIK